MTFNAQVIKVMIASPGDVAEEREIIRDVLHTWNNNNAEERNIILLPVSWETHSFPCSGAHPQEIINQQVLKDCDILIGVFWTRLGTATLNAASGTVEEIQEHIKAGKPTMLYFSNADISPSKIDHEQYNAVLKFKKEYTTNGLYFCYKSLEVFKEKLTNQLQICLNKNFNSEKVKINNLHKCAKVTDALDWQGQLSNEVKIFLKATSHGGDGSIHQCEQVNGYIFEMGPYYIETDFGREEARWKQCLKDLLHFELVEEIKQNNKYLKTYALTEKGWKISDTLPNSFLEGLELIPDNSKA